MLLVLNIKKIRRSHYQLEMRFSARAMGLISLQAERQVRLMEEMTEIILGATEVIVI